MRTLLENLREDAHALCMQNIRVGGRFVINDIEQAIARIKFLQQPLALPEPEAQIVEAIRVDAIVTHQPDKRSPADMRRQQRRLIAIIDRLTRKNP